MEVEVRSSGGGEGGARLQTDPQMQTRMLSEPTITRSETRLTRIVRMRLRMTSVAAIPPPMAAAGLSVGCDLAP